VHIAGSENLFRNSTGATVSCTDDVRLANASNNQVTNNGTITADQLSFESTQCTVVNAGILTATGGIRVSANTSDNKRIDNQAGAQLHIGSDINLQDADFFLYNNGTVDVDGDLVQQAGAEGYYNYNGSIFRWAGSTAVDAAIYTNYASNTFCYDRAGAQAILVPSDGAYWNIELQTSGSKTTSSNLDINGSIDIEDAAQLDATGIPAGQITVGGNWTNTSSHADPFVEGSTRVTFDGTGGQAISSAGETFYELEMDNTALGGVTITSGMVTVNQELVLKDGVVHNSSSTLVALADNVLASGATDASYIEGPMRKIGNDAFDFPVGKDGTLRSISIGAPANVTDAFDAEYFDSNPDPSYDITLSEASISNVSSVEYWTLTQSSGTASVEVTLSWNTASFVGNLSELKVARWNGSLWADHGSGSVSGTTSAGTIATSAAIGSFGPFTLASPNAANNPLPVELLDFAAIGKEQHVALQWTTASELNNAGFWVERSEDGQHFDALAWVPGAGTVSTLRSYNYKDVQPLEGRSFYRLRQLDVDGTETLSALELVEHRRSESLAIRAWPNPSRGQLQLASNREQMAYEFRNSLGQVVHAGAVGPATQTIDLSAFPAGMYWLIAGREGQQPVHQQSIILTH